MLYYYPSYTFRKELPETAKKVIDYLNADMQIMGCCRVDKMEHKPDSTAVVICQSCRDTVQSKMKVISLWEYFLEQGFYYPDYSGLTVNVQDCWRERNQPEVRAAIRQILGKMNIKAIEIEPNGVNSDFCGTWHYEAKSPELIAKMNMYKGKPLMAMPEEIQIEAMREAASRFSCDIAVTGCGMCLKGMKMGGVNGIHLLELLFKTANI